MSISSVFWLFLLLIALQPVIQQKMLEFSRLKLLAKLDGSGSGDGPGPAALLRHMDP